MSKKSIFPWYQQPRNDDIESKLLKAVNRTGEVYSRIDSWQKTLQASAQALNRGGEHNVDPAELAFKDRCDEETVHKVFRAFEEVGLTVDGKCATFVEREQTKDQRRHAKDRAQREERERKERESAPAATAPPRGADAPHFDPCAPRDAADAARAATESSESSSRDDVREIDIPSLVVLDQTRAREASTTTDDAIFQSISKIERISEKVARAGVPVVRKWLSEGCSLELDILRELRRIAQGLNNGLRSLSAEFVAKQIAERRDKRVSGVSAANFRTRRDPELEFAEIAGNA